MFEGLLYKDLTYKIRHCIFDVQNDIGIDYDEETYHQALKMKFKQDGILYSSKDSKILNHRGISRIKSYLQSLKLKIGLAVNYGKSKLEIRGVYQLLDKEMLVKVSEFN